MQGRGSLVRRVMPKTFALSAFVGFSVVIIAFGDVIVATLLVASDTQLQDLMLYERIKVLIVGLLVSVVGLISYLSLYQYTLRLKTKSIAEEMVSDLMLSREQFRMLYDNSPVPYFLMDDQGVIRNPNKAALRFFGGTTQECEVGNFYMQLVPEGSQAEQNIELLKTKVERGVPVTKMEVRVKLFSGSIRWVQVSIYSLDRSSPIPFKHLVTLLDVTSEKESDAVKTDFLLLASHQLRTPTTTIKWYVDYLLTNKSFEFSDIVRGYLKEIYAGNERMIELVTTLLTVSRIEMGTLAPEYVPVHMDALVRDLLTELRPDTEKKAHVLDVRSEGDDKIVTDKTMVRIIVHNLLTNAIKYTPSSGTLTIHCRYGLHDAEVAVSDSGCGIPYEEQDKIFTKMYRASNAKKVSTNGTGLGLYLVKEFAMKLGGTIDFVSDPQKGSTFTLTLPRVAPDA